MSGVNENACCSVVIVTRDRPEFLREAVHSILAGTLLPDEIVIVDQGTGSEVALATFDAGACEIRFVRSAGGGAGRGRNQGIDVARHPLIAFTDDDVLVEAAWLEQMLTSLRRGGKRTVITGRVLPAPNPGPGRAMSVKTEQRPEQYEGRLKVDVLFSNSMALFSSALDEVGGFDERLGPGSRYSSSEDNDLGYRLLEAGYRIHYVPEAVLYHRAWRHGGELRLLNWMYGRGQGAFYAKHLSLRDPHMLTRFVGLFRERGVRIARRPLRQRSLSGHGDVIYSVGAFSAFFEWLVVERLVPRMTGRAK
jgi:GT2 family glycosyltransferase